MPLKLQTVPSSTGVLLQVPLAESQTSLVHSLSSLQSALVSHSGCVSLHPTNGITPSAQTHRNPNK
jgi:hypothetical protein